MSGIKKCFPSLNGEKLFLTSPFIGLLNPVVAYEFFAHLSLIAGQISRPTLPFGHTHA